MRIAELRKNVRKHKVINFPDQDFKVALIRLGANELIEANVKTTQRLNKEQVINEDILALMNQLEQLALAIRDPECLNTKIITREELEFEELSVIAELFEEWAQVQSDDADTIDEITQEDFEELKKKLKKMDWKDYDGESLKTLNYLQMTLASKADMNN